MKQVAGKLIVIDGIAGSGKSTLLKAVKEKLAEDHKIFDLSEWIKNEATPPRFQDALDYDIIFTFEPTKQWVGTAIRYELSRTDDPYQALGLAHAFALDRLIQYRRLIIPLLKRGKIIIQDRSVSTSIVYQPIMDNGPALEELLVLPGNALAIKYAPNHLIITHINPELLAQRLNGRDDDSKGVFENLNLLKKVDERFKSDWFSELFTSNGTHVHHFSTEIPIEEMKMRAINLIKNLIK